jgi:hypothetical protein
MLGAFVFLVIAGTGRAGVFGPEFARSGRYVYMVVAMSLPALAAAADAIVRRWRLLLPAVLLLLVIGIPGNVEYLAKREEHEPSLLGNPTLMLALPRMPLADEVPRKLVPVPEIARQVTIGWLLDGVESGRVPDPGPIGSTTAAQATFRLSIHQSNEPRPSSSCSALSQPVERNLVRGQSLGIKGYSVLVTELTPKGNMRYTIIYAPDRGHTLTVVSASLMLQLAPANPFLPVTLCG